MDVLTGDFYYTFQFSSIGCKHHSVRYGFGPGVVVYVLGKEWEERKRQSEVEWPYVQVALE